MSGEDVCTNFKFGFCKYGVRCRKRHIEAKCDNKDCDVKNCDKRHLYECRFYRVYKRCKFADYCLYDHIDHTDPATVELNMIRTKLDMIEK